MIIKSFDLYDFRREFERYDRGNNFSDEGLEELFDYYDSFPEPYELDVIEICCNWTEYETLEDFAKAYMDESDFEGLEEYEKKDLIFEELDNNTYYIKLYTGGILIQNY